MKMISFLVLWVFMAMGCSNRKIEITTEYIINDNWNEVAKAIKINKMKLKQDSTLNLTNVSQSDILSKLEVDSSFIYYSNVKARNGTFKDLKVYFNKDNGFSWSNENHDTTRILGNLGKGNWYKFSYLVTYPYYVYVYIDTLNNLHRFDVDVSYY